MEFSVENLCGFLIRSKLMSGDEMQAMRRRWLAEARDTASQVPAFLKWLVSNHYVTEYQAILLARGQVDDFFLGPYKILERIGRGRMAGVYKAIHPSGQIVAIKVLPPSRAKNTNVLARFEREARLAVKLKHPNVVRAFQLGAVNRVHHLVMEYLEGETVEDLLQRRKRLSAEEAVHVVHQALGGLQHIHEQGMVHRDLKPANLMLLPARGDKDNVLSATVKILDIGLAREFFDENSPAPAGEPMDLTGEGVLLGTPDYLAPEQARDPRTIDIRADIYSLGCVLYHLLTGQPPFPDKNILNQMVRHATEPARPLQEFNPSIPKGLQQIVNWMMAKKPDERYPTPLRAAQALQAFMLVVSDSPPLPEETPQLRRYLTWLETAPEAGPQETTEPPAQRGAKVMTPPNMPREGSRRRESPPADAHTPFPVAKMAPPERRYKRRTNLKLVPAAGTPALPVKPAAPPASAVPPSGTESDPPPGAGGGGHRFRWRDLIMLGIGAGAMLVLYLLWALVSRLRG